MSRYLIYVDKPATGWRLDRIDLLRKVIIDWPDAVVMNAEIPEIRKCVIWDGESRKENW